MSAIIDLKLKGRDHGSGEQKHNAWSPRRALSHSSPVALVLSRSREVSDVCVLRMKDVLRHDQS